MQRRFRQLDVFATGPYSGNPLAVVVDGDGLSTDEMQRFANWTNLSETTFVLPPTDPTADYRVRIFTTTWELPFAGHPTLGTCAAWLEAGGQPNDTDTIVQECGIGLVTIRRDGEHLAFAAPDLIRSGPVDDELRARVERTLATDVVDVAWADNGPGWVVAELASADDVLALEPDFDGTLDLKLGVVGRAGGSVDHDVEVRAFFPGPASMEEDPVTGSLNASIAQWLMARDPELTSYVARQGTALGRDGRVRLERDQDGVIWVGGRVTTSVTGTVEIERPELSAVRP
ncbi:PhzF family phenazine biosynthesis protein [Ilumatobacter sp.]|uniref:PhzF family phenazine biosynthesis protein n=1 Tax=Ilumatobacter sp. TaxID=1967498 RepID=UPI003AF48341